MGNDKDLSEKLNIFPSRLVRPGYFPDLFTDVYSFITLRVHVICEYQNGIPFKPSDKNICALTMKKNMWKVETL